MPNWTRAVMLLLCVLVGAAGCERKPVFFDPVPEHGRGGFLVACSSVTDFKRRLTYCPAFSFRNMTGGCACRQGVGTEDPALLSLPPAIPGIAMGAVAFRDSACVTTYLNACMPRVIPTTLDWDEGGLPAGQLRLDRILKVDPNNMLFPARVDQNGDVIPDQAKLYQYRDEYKDEMDVWENPREERVGSDINAVMRAGCELAHFGALANHITGFGAGTFDWKSATDRIALQYHPSTTTLDGYDLFTQDAVGNVDRNQPWGLVGRLVGPSMGPSLVEYRDFVTHPIPPIATNCHPDKIYPALGIGYDTVLDIGAGRAPYIGNPPPTETGAPRLASAQRVVLSSGSAGMLTIQGFQPVGLEFEGGAEVRLKDCNAQGSCVANLHAITLSASPFEIAGYKVAVMRIVADDAATGVWSNNSLAFDSFSGTAEVQLVDGRYDNIPMTSGVVLARWDAARDQVVMAFSFSTTSDGIDIDIAGTVFGKFDNVSPIANIAVTSPVNARSGALATVECQSPSGTDITLSGQGSVDRESSPLRYGWRDDTQQLIGEARDVTVDHLPTGTSNYHLMVYDASGFAGDDRISVSIMDTLAPAIETASFCVWPPNHRNVSIRLGMELSVTATDQCEGDVSGRVSIVAVSDVTNGTDTGVVRWSNTEACLAAERSGGDLDGRKYDITLSVVDGANNASQRIVRVTIPHDGAGTECLRTQSLNTCN